MVEEKEWRGLNETQAQRVKIDKRQTRKEWQEQRVTSPHSHCPLQSPYFPEATLRLLHWGRQVAVSRSIGVLMYRRHQSRWMLGTLR